MEKMKRNKFFAALGKSAIFVAIISAIPFKFFSNFSKSSGSKKINITIHPSAVKRNSKV